LNTLTTAARQKWLTIEFAAPVTTLDPLRVRTHEVRISGESYSAHIGVNITEVVPKFEAFYLDAWADENGVGNDPRFSPPEYVDSGELLSAFNGSAHQLIVICRELDITDYRNAADVVLVEDLLMIRHPSGQTAFILPDADQPGTLIVTRTLGKIRSEHLREEYRRVL
jgi:hypothetical protein